MSREDMIGSLVVQKAKKEKEYYDKTSIKELLNQLVDAIYAGYFQYANTTRSTYLLNMAYDHMLPIVGEEATKFFFEQIPYIRQILSTDLDAIFEGDPAANSKQEVILSYPGFYAITVHRIAHQLYLADKKIVARVMSEIAHSKTGIDINPGATIGEYFFIDHGTGIVVGETTIIGRNVKMYQGVTLGAISTKGGQKLKGKRRHPTIKDNVTLYSGASVLGDITIYENCVIGSNVFITKDVEANTTVFVEYQQLKYKKK